MWSRPGGLGLDRRLCVLVAGWLFTACSGGGSPGGDGGPAGGPDGGIAGTTQADAARVTTVAADLFDQPLAGLTGPALDRFAAGDRLFGTPLRLSDGLGPLYIRTSCAACHVDGGRGPGLVRKFQVVDATTGAPIADAPELSLGGTERPYAVAGATKPLLAPQPLPGHTVVLSRRVGPTVMGRGYIEAVLDSEIEQRAAEQAARPDGIHGRINRVTYHSQAVAGVAVPHAFAEPGLIGRFGLKARVATLDDFAADAFQGDMGLTSPMRPDELANPEGIRDDLKAGPDLSAETVTTVAAYVRTIDIPLRTPPSGPGSAAFSTALCSVCHVPTMRTRADFPVPALAGIDAPIFSDLLLHDLGEDLADRLTDEQAGPRDWRTAPLIALRFQRAYLHDGRARTIEEAVLMHAGAGSEANGAVESFKALSPEDRSALLAFVQGL
jgi:CxxC motif-containing protein (DUF1111 family)